MLDESPQELLGGEARATGALPQPDELVQSELQGQGLERLVVRGIVVEIEQSGLRGCRRRSDTRTRSSPCRTR